MVLVVRDREETPEVCVGGVGGQVVRPITCARLQYHLLDSLELASLNNFVHGDRRR